MSSRLPAEDAMVAVLRKYPSRVRAILLDVLTERDDAERARRIGEFHANERSRGFAELLIDLEEDKSARAFVVGMLQEVR